MTDYSDDLTQVTDVLALADATGADRTWTAWAILQRLKELGWQPPADPAPEGTAT